MSGTARALTFAQCGVGFALISALIVFLVDRGINTRETLLIVRGGFAVFCGLLFFRTIFPRLCFRVSATFGLLLLFWAIYLLRIVHDGFIDPQVLRLPPLDYLAYAIGMCLVPALSFLRLTSERELNLAYQTIFICTFFAVALSVWVYRGQLGTNFGRLGMTGDAAVNPLTVAYLSAVLVALCLYDLALNGVGFRLRSVASFTGIMIACVGLLIGASRGPVVACMVAIACVSYWKIRRGHVSRSIFVWLLAVACTIGVGVIADVAGSNLWERMLYTSDEIAIGTVEHGRLYFIEQAFKEYQSAPIFGSGIEVKATGTYPHNLIIESFLATGTLGGVLFVGLLISLLRKAFTLLESGRSCGWLPMLFFMSVIESQVSGALYLSYNFWYLAVMVLAAEENGVLKKTTKEPVYQRSGVVNLRGRITMPTHQK